MSANPPAVRILVVIPARNAAATIEATLAALAEQDLEQPFETVVVDDGSTDKTAALAEASPLSPSVIRLGRSQGAGSARNAGVGAGSAEWIAFTDSDCAPEPEWLRESLAALAGKDLVQGTVLPALGPRGPFDRTVEVRSPSAFYETANLLTTREIFDRVGGFEDLLRHREKDKGIGEDVLFGWKVRRAGGRVGFSERSVVRHVVSPRGPRAYIAERLRLWYFPDLYKRVPELRAERAFARLFLSPRTACFDLAVGSALIATTLTPWGAVAALPYVINAYPQAVRAGRRRAPVVAAVDLAADAVGMLSLLAGSLQNRSLLL